MECCGKAMSCFQMKSAGFHEIHRISKDQLPGMVSPMFAHCPQSTDLSQGDVVRLGQEAPLASMLS